MRESLRAIALANVCYLPEETQHPRFGGVMGDFGLRLTVNAGFE